MNNVASSALYYYDYRIHNNILGDCTLTILDDTCPQVNTGPSLCNCKNVCLSCPGMTLPLVCLSNTFNLCVLRNQAGWSRESQLNNAQSATRYVLLATKKKHATTKYSPLRNAGLIILNNMEMIAHEEKRPTFQQVNLHPTQPIRMAR